MIPSWKKEATDSISEAQITGWWTCAMWFQLFSFSSCFVLVTFCAHVFQGFHSLVWIVPRRRGWWSASPVRATHGYQNWPLLRSVNGLLTSWIASVLETQILCESIHWHSFALAWLQTMGAPWLAWDAYRKIKPPDEVFAWPVPGATWLTVTLREYERVWFREVFSWIS